MTDRRLHEWLLGLGLGRYSTVFEENGVDWDVVCELSDEDLRTLGVPLGHRRKLLKASRLLQAEGAQARPAAISGLSDSGRVVPLMPRLARASGIRVVDRPSPSAPQQEERRQITVLFCDMVGSTAMSQRLDPEDMLDVIRSYQKACSTVIAGLGGSIAQYLGDGVVAYFGYPQAHEDDAERSVRAGLGIVEAIGPLNARLRRDRSLAIAVRIGIATGIVVVGDLGGEGSIEERIAIGGTPNLAARLQTLAAPDTVVIAETTHRLLSHRFECEDLGEHKLAGFSAEQRVLRVVRPLDAESRLASAGLENLNPFVGRERELAKLGDYWQATIGGSGQTVLIGGDPGIGKSRLLLAFDAVIAASPHLRIRYHCSSFHQNTAFHPVIEQVSRAAGFEPDDTDLQRLRRLEALLVAGTTPNEQAVPLLAALLSISTAGRYPPLDISPKKQKQLTLAALAEQIECRARDLPILVVFEDVQWMDASTEQYFELLAGKSRDRRLMIVATCRTTALPRWSGGHDFAHIRLDRLPPRATAEMIEFVLAGRRLAKPVFEQIVDRTGGVPLFIEELTKWVLESACGREGSEDLHWPDDLPARSIPATIHDSLMARLDQLALPRDIAQIGSVIGRRFSYALLAEVTALPDASLRDALARLIGSELIYCRGSPPRATYTFKHALIQDAAYESLLFSKRRQLHARIASVIELRFPEQAEADPEILAYHFSEAGAGDRAVPHWLRAANKASAGSATVEAVNHLRRGLNALRLLPQSPARQRQELELQLPLAAALIGLAGAGSAEVEGTYRRALELCAQLPESPLHFTALWGWWRISMNFRAGRERADALLALAQRLSDPGLLLQAHHCLWATKYNLGDQVGCLAHVDQGLALYDAIEHRAQASLYGGHDAKVCALGEAAQSLWLLGRPDQALARIAEAKAHAWDLGHAGSIAHVMDMTLLLYRYLRDAVVVHEQAEMMQRFCEEKGFPDQLAKSAIFRGWATAVMGSPGEGLKELEQGLAQQRRIGTQEDFPIYFEMLAEVCQAEGRIEQGLTGLEEAFAIVEDRGIHFWEAELHRRRGELLTLADDRAGAETALRRALEIARAQEVRALELRAAISLARLWQGLGRRSDALATLQSVNAPDWTCCDVADRTAAAGLQAELLGSR